MSINVIVLYNARELDKIFRAAIFFRGDSIGETHNVDGHGVARWKEHFDDGALQNFFPRGFASVSFQSAEHGFKFICDV